MSDVFVHMQPFVHTQPVQTQVKIAGAGMSCYREIMQTEMCHLERKTKRSEKAKGTNAVETFAYIICTEAAGNSGASFIALSPAGIP